MRELKNFTPTPKEKEVKKDSESTNGYESVPSGVEDMIKSREGKSEGELMEELLKSVKQSKEEGRYSQEEMERFKNTVTPLLTDEQRKKLDEILDKLK